MWEQRKRRDEANRPWAGETRWLMGRKMELIDYVNNKEWLMGGPGEWKDYVPYGRMSRWGNDKIDEGLP